MANRELGILTTITALLLAVFSIMTLAVLLLPADGINSNQLNNKIDGVYGKYLNKYHHLREGQSLEHVCKVFDSDSLYFVKTEKKRGDDGSLIPTAIYRFDIIAEVTGKKSQENGPYIEMQFQDEKLRRKEFRNPLPSKRNNHLVESRDRTIRADVLTTDDLVEIATGESQCNSSDTDPYADLGDAFNDGFDWSFD